MEERHSSAVLLALANEPWISKTTSCARRERDQMQPQTYQVLNTKNTFLANIINLLSAAMHTLILLPK